MKAAQPKNILVLDDNKNDLLMAKFVIKRMGHNPILIEKPSQIIDVLQAQPVSLIILDIDMPGLTGLEVLKKVKKLNNYKTIPIAMLTGHSEMSHVKTAISTGAVDYIIKPIDPEVFESKVKKLIGDIDESTKNEWIEYEIKKASDAEIRVYVTSQLVSLGELSLTLKTFQPVPAGLTFYAESQLFKELEINQPPLKVENCTQHDDFYLVRCALLGLSEADLKKIRLYNQLLVKKSAA